MRSRWPRASPRRRRSGGSVPTPIAHRQAAHEELHRDVFLVPDTERDHEQHAPNEGERRDLLGPGGRIVQDIPQEDLEQHDADHHGDHHGGEREENLLDHVEQRHQSFHGTITNFRMSPGPSAAIRVISSAPSSRETVRVTRRSARSGCRSRTSRAETKSSRTYIAVPTKEISLTWSSPTGTSCSALKTATWTMLPPVVTAPNATPRSEGTPAATKTAP